MKVADAVFLKLCNCLDKRIEGGLLFTKTHDLLTDIRALHALPGEKSQAALLSFHFLMILCF